MRDTRALKRLAYMERTHEEIAKKLSESSAYCRPVYLPELRREEYVHTNKDYAYILYCVVATREVYAVDKCGVSYAQL